MTTLKDRLLIIFEQNKGKALTKGMLAAITEKNIRSIRFAISELREDGHLITSNSKEKGYMLSENIDDPAVQHYIAEQMHRIKEIWKVVQPFVKQMPMKGQMDFWRGVDNRKINKSAGGTVHFDNLTND